MTPEECVALGGHCFEPVGTALTTTPPQYPEECRHCPQRRIAIPQEPFSYRYEPPLTPQTDPRIIHIGPDGPREDP